MTAEFDVGDVPGIEAAFNFGMPHDQDGVTITPLWPPDTTISRLGPATDDDENRVRYRVTADDGKRSSIYRVGDDITEEFSGELRQRAQEIAADLPGIYRAVFADRARAFKQQAQHEQMIKALVLSAQEQKRLACRFDEPAAEDFPFLCYASMCEQTQRAASLYHARAQLSLQSAALVSSEVAVLFSAWFGVNLPILVEPWLTTGQEITTEWDGETPIELRVKVGPLPLAVDRTTLRDDMLVSNIPTILPQLWCQLHPEDAENAAFRTHIQRVMQGSNLAVPRGPRLITPR